MISSTYLIVLEDGTTMRGNWLSQGDFEAADRGRMILINLQTQQRYHRAGAWKDIQVRPGEPLVLVEVDHEVEEEDRERS
jgi:hypothetical protein